MANLLILCGALFLVLLVLVSWRARARAMKDATRLEAEGTRGRELESIAMDAASLLAATLQSIDTARELASSGPAGTRSALNDAARAGNALSDLFQVARLYLRPQDGAIVHGSAEGCVRVAIAVARSRGCGISVRGEQTALQFRGRPEEACEVLVEVLDACRSALGPGDFVEVHLVDEEVRIAAGPGKVPIPHERAAEVGWSIEPTAADGRAGLTIRTRTSSVGERREPVGAAGQSARAR